MDSSSTDRPHIEPSVDVDLADGLSHADAALAMLLVELAPDALLVTDRRGIITQVNRRVEELFGYERSQLVGQAIELLMPVGARRVHTAHRLRYVAQPQVRPMGLDLDLWGRRADGAEFPVEVSLSPCQLRGEDLVIASVRDVSARRATEQAMRNLLQMLEGVSEAVYLIDPDTLAFTYVNAAACAQAGYSNAELLQMTPLHLVPAFTETAFREQVESLINGQTQALAFTTALRRRDGNDVIVECDVSLPTALRAQPPMLVAIVRDISARLEHEAQSRAARELVALLDDRDRIARDLHDTVIQDLFASGLALEGISMRAPSEIRQRISEVVDSLDATIRQVRSTIFGLGSRRGNHQSLLAQAHSVVDEATRVLGYRPTFRAHGAIDTIATATLAEHLIPTLREWLSNIARHAQATRVEIDLDLADATLTLVIADNGVGLAPDAPAGNGIRNLTERAQQLGGTMVVTPNRPTGTTLIWTART